MWKTQVCETATLFHAYSDEGDRKYAENLVLRFFATLTKLISFKVVFMLVHSPSLQCTCFREHLTVLRESSWILVLRLPVSEQNKRQFSKHAAVKTLKSFGTRQERLE